MSNTKDHSKEVISKDCNFAENVRILAVDDNLVCLKVLSALLRKCGYQFTTATEANEAYEILKKDRDKFDLVLTNVKNITGDFKLVELIQLEMDIPVILISADDGPNTMAKGMRIPIVQGYIFKPVLESQIKLLWRHVTRKANFESTKTNPNQVPNLKRRNNEINDTELENQEMLIKKPRFNWTQELTRKFESAVKELGDKAVPKTILTKMNVAGLERSHVASKLQKYRKRCADEKESNRKKAIMQQEAIHRILSENRPENRELIAHLRTVNTNLNFFANPQNNNNIPSGNYIPMSRPGNFGPMHPPSSSNGPIRTPISNQSFQMAQPATIYRAMQPPSSSYGARHILIPNQSTQMALHPQHVNALFTRGRIQMHDSIQQTQMTQPANHTPGSPPKDSSQEQGSGPSSRASNSLSPSSLNEFPDPGEFDEILAMIYDDSAPSLATNHQHDDPSFSPSI